MKLQQYRKTMNIKPREACQQLDIPASTLWRWETGKYIPDREAMKRIRDWSGGVVTANDFYYDGDAGEQ